MAVERLKTGVAVAEICAAANLSDAALQRLADAPGAREFVERLVVNGELDDAVAFLAHALPSHEAVSWAWSCARDAAGEPPPAPVLASLDATRSWLDEPTEPYRSAALRAAELVGLTSPAGLAGLAAFLCGQKHGSVGTAPAPPPSAAAKAIAGCVHLTAEADDYDVAVGYADQIQRGLELADRIELWSPPDPRTE